MAAVVVATWVICGEEKFEWGLIKTLMRCIGGRFGRNFPMRQRTRPNGKKWELGAGHMQLLSTLRPVLL